MTANNLDTTEQFRIGGPDTVRAFATGEGTGDSGATATVELRLLPPESWFGRIAREMVFSVFGDAGYVQYRYPPARHHRAQPDRQQRQVRRCRPGGELGAAGGLFRCAPPLPSRCAATRAPARSSRTRQVYLQAAMLFN